MKTVDYLNKALKKLDLSNDYALSKYLEIGSNTMSQYRKGHRIIDNYTAVRLAQILEINPIEIIAAANMEREKEGPRREFWAKLASGTQCILFVAALTGGNIEKGRTELPIAHNVYYVK